MSVSESAAPGRSKSSPDRILDADRGVLRNSNYFAYHDVPMMFGYHGNQMKIYDQYWFRQGKSNDHSFVLKVSSDPQKRNQGRIDWLNMSFIGMAGVKYLVTDFLTDLGLYRDSLTQISQTQNIQADNLILYEFPDNFRRVRLYHDYVLEEDNEAVLSFMRTFSHDWTRQAVLESDPGFTGIPDADISGEFAEIVSFGTDEVVVNVNSNSDALVYLADCYYPAWKAYVDGRKTDILLTNGAFRSVPVSSGEHTVVFKYESESYNTSRAVTWASSMFVALVLIFNLFIRGRKGKDTLE